MTNLRRFAILLLLLAFAAGVYLRHEQAAPSGQLTAVVVEDSAHRTPTIGAVIGAPEVLAVVKAKHIAWHVVDQAATGPDLAEVQFALDASKNKPLPALVMRHGTSKAKVISLPKTAVAAAAVLSAS
jgi:hypothetical protein